MRSITFTPIAVVTCFALAGGCTSGKSKGGGEVVTRTVTKTMDVTPGEQDGCRFTWLIAPEVSSSAVSVHVTAEIEVHHPRSWTGLDPELTVVAADGESFDVVWTKDGGLVPTIWRANYDSGTRTDVPDFPNGTWELRVIPATEEDCLRIREATMTLTAVYTLEFISEEF